MATLMDWFGWVKSLPEDIRHEALMVLYGLWLNRNQVVWNHTFESPPVILQRSRQHLRKWQAVHALFAATPSPPPRTAWNPPPVGCYKCNVDFFIVAGQHLFGMGMILQDSNGRGMMGQMRTIPGTDDPALGEALTFKEALNWLKRTQARKLW
ncbi:hypothetical protein K2173_022336 [Erythroxylum novogranatense]|uniref:Uncharacterized protein n=1 Tax=Erythroxylum novogranatense TaxID=1862640 RepID=A0AAV8THI6_9ROSI|nr:hypothetical protein K2173_022336 [Erythroxylum novogranatense]